MGFVVEEAGAAVLFRESFEGAVFVLLYADVDVAGDADVECAGVAAHDVGVAGNGFVPPWWVWLSIKCWDLGLKGSGGLGGVSILRGPSTTLRSAQDDGLLDGLRR